MYAIIQTGGKQYRVFEGDTIKVEKLPAEPGAQVAFDQVLLVADGDKVRVGTPYLADAQVMARVESHGRGKKVRIIKFRRRKHYMKRQGHRQWYTAVKITAIQAD